MVGHVRQTVSDPEEGGPGPVHRQETGQGPDAQLLHVRYTQHTQLHTTHTTHTTTHTSYQVVYQHTHVYFMSDSAATHTTTP